MAVRVNNDLVVTTRPLVEDDIDFLRGLYYTTRDDLARLAMSDQDKIQLLNHQFESQHVHYQRHFTDADFDMVLLDGVSVGRLYVDYGPTEIRVIDIAILPEFRGQGIGTRLMGEVLDRARLEQMPVRLRVETHNPALQWYTGMGFQKIADEQIQWHLEWNAVGSESEA